MPDNEADALASRRVQALAQELRKETIAELNDTAGDRARRKVFDRKQLVSDADLEVGGHIQKLVALELRASGAKRQRLLWERGPWWEDDGQERSSKNGRHLKIP